MQIISTYELFFCILTISFHIGHVIERLEIFPLKSNPGVIYENFLIKALVSSPLLPYRILKNFNLFLAEPVLL